MKIGKYLTKKMQVDTKSFWDAGTDHLVSFSDYKNVNNPIKNDRGYLELIVNTLNFNSFALCVKVMRHLLYAGLIAQ